MTTKINIDGAILVGSTATYASAAFDALAATTGAPLGPKFSEADGAHVERACALADEARDTFAATSPEARAAFLTTIGENIERLGDALLQRTHEETALPMARLASERGRTIGQLNMFAAVIREDACFDKRVDPPLPDRQPAARPELRSVRIPIGPVAVFGSSNFPFAFSVAGGDTASALAAGCPVIVKGHPAHPGAGEYVARAIIDAANKTGMPEGVFSYLPGAQHTLGAALASDPRIQAIAFTGSQSGGLALAAIAAQRSAPIPVFAEMGSVNPVILAPHKLERDAEALALDFVASMTLGVGQFCTNPGLVIGLRGAALDRFVAAANETLSAVDAGTMLTPSMCSAYENGIAKLSAHAACDVVARGKPRTSNSVTQAEALLLRTNAKHVIDDPSLVREVFGPCSLIVACESLGEMRALIASLEGQLTCSIHLDADDAPAMSELAPLLMRKAGRILANGWPTGVEVANAMVHGGPFPATTDARFTSVGAMAIERFLRPICFQNMPPALLPALART